MIEIRQATASDHGAIFTLQRAAFVDEARIYGTPFVPALDETLTELIHRLGNSTTWVAEDDRRIVGAISLRSYRPGGPDIERLMVAPDCRGSGIASLLLSEVETHAVDNDVPQLQLIVGDLAHNNRAIYKHLGWVEQSSHRLEGFDDVLLRTMTKQIVRKT